jgi:hypothetical protein
MYVHKVSSRVPLSENLLEQILLNKTVDSSLCGKGKMQEDLQSKKLNVKNTVYRVLKQVKRFKNELLLDRL